MMSTKTSQLHSLAHTVMLIVIVGLLSLYIQLHNRYTGLSASCASLHRNIRVSSELENHCAGSGTNSMNSHVCFHSEDSSTATTPVPLPASRPSSQVTINSGERYSQTNLAAHKLVSVSISESSFDSEHKPFETTVPLTVDEFGKTDESQSEVEETLSTVSSTDVISHSQMSQVELTKTNMREFLKSQGTQKREVIATAKDFTLKPSSTLEKQTKKQINAYSEYNKDETPQNDDTATESVFSSGSDAGISSSVTSFGAISLSISETSGEVIQLATSAKKQNFGKTYSGVYSDDDVRQDGAITSTENVSGDYMIGCGNGCRAENEDDSDDIELTNLHIQPVPPDVIPGIRGSDRSNADVVDNGLRGSDRSNADVRDNDIRGLDQSNADVANNDQGHVSRLLEHAGADDVQRLVYKGTSAWCGSSDSGGIYTCRFQNLCYKVAEHDFIFLKGEQSVVERKLSLSEADDAGLFDINLSTLSDHNAFTFSPIFLPAQSLYKFSSVAILGRKSFIMHRFKPDNIMHVLHDDILPLHRTLHSLDLIRGNEKSEVTLLLTDQFDIGEYANLYRSLSTLMPVSLQNLNYTADIICFADTYVGLLNSTLWYQYGFFKVQGPLTVNSSDVLRHSRDAVHYLARHFYYECMLCTSRNYLVLLSRKDNRLILNEGDLMMSLARSTKLKVLSVSMETHPLEEVISMVKSSRGIIGMHGSLLSFLIFLQPGAFVIELFPYAVNPSKYTPFKTFCDLPDSGIIYKSWANLDRYKSTPHPDWDAEVGGVHHLPHDTQRYITGQSQVPDHLCCEDPSWLYHIYQDTEVDVEAVTLLTSNALTEATNLQVNSKSPAKLVKDIPITPGPVKDLACKLTEEIFENDDFNVKFLLVWKLPWNLEFIEYGNLEYQLVISEPGNDASTSISLPFSVTFYSLGPARPHTVYNVWLRVTIDNTLNGPYAFVACTNSL